jgi:hypothetical protein
MPSSSVVSWTEPIGRSAEDVWTAVRDFGCASWSSVDITVEGDGLGAVRTVHMPNGDVSERCERLDDEARVLSYSIVAGNPFPISDYLATMTVRPVDEGSSELVWSATWRTDEDPAPLEARLTRFIRGTARVLRRALDGTD